MLGSREEQENERKLLYCKNVYVTITSGSFI